MCRLSADRLNKGSGPYEEMNLVFLSLCLYSVHAEYLQWPRRWDAERLQWSRRRRQQKDVWHRHLFIQTVCISSQFNLKVQSSLTEQTTVLDGFIRDRPS